MAAVNGRSLGGPLAAVRGVCHTILATDTGRDVWDRTAGRPGLQLRSGANVIALAELPD